MFAHARGLLQRLFENKTWHKAIGWALITGLLLAGMPVALSMAALTLSLDGPRTAREGDLIEYRLQVSNEGAAAVSGGEVLVDLSGRTDFVDARSLPDGFYDALSGVWTLPRLKTVGDERSATLTLQLLVHPGLLSDADDVVVLVQRATITSPDTSADETAEIKTHVVCGFCNDWKLNSVKLHSKTDLDQDDYELEVRYIFDVKVTNNGPVKSRARVTARQFTWSGKGVSSPTLMPEAPVELRLDVGESELVKFYTSWEEFKSNQTLEWTFEVRDLSLHDPIDSNTASDSDTNKTILGGNDSSSGGCTLNPANRFDPLWLLMVLLPIMRPLWRRQGQ